MNSQLPAAGTPTDPDIEWMENTYPLREDWIQAAIDRFAASNERALAHGKRAPGEWAAQPANPSGAFYVRVTGPVGGYYIASHACRAADSRGMGYTGVYKICDVAPASYWTAQCLQFGSCKHTEASGARALASAESAAARHIAGMPIRPRPVTP